MQPTTTSTAITDGIRITVTSRYLAEQSTPLAHRYVWAYTVRITNEGGSAARLESDACIMAGVPSIIYGLLGLGLFVRALGMDRSVMAGASTLALLALPVVILSTREALRTVPSSIREGSYALGATKWQTIWHQVLPMSLPGIMTGLILALSRAIGETAPLITIGALTYVPFAPDGIWSPFTVMPIQIFNWVSRPQLEFRTNAAAAILVLLALLLTMNAAAIWLRDRYQKTLT